MGNDKMKNVKMNFVDINGKEHILNIHDLTTIIKKRYKFKLWLIKILEKMIAWLNSKPFTYEFTSKDWSIDDGK